MEKKSDLSFGISKEHERFRVKAYMKGYESKFAFFFDILTRSSTGPIKILEVGAHFGEDTQRFLHTFGDRLEKIYCFEPDPRSIEVFMKHVSDERVSLFHSALSNENGILPFYQSHNPHELTVPEKYGWIENDDYSRLRLANSGASSLKKGYHLTLEKSIDVDAVRYDNWATENEISSIDLAWIDVQGAEKDVIEGMGAEVQNIKYVWIEFGEMQYEGSLSFIETVSLMTEKGFVLEGTTATSPINSSGDALFRFGNKNG